MASPLNGLANAAGFIPTQESSFAPVYWRGGVPLDADGSLAIESADPVSWNQGLPLTANGRVATQVVSPTTWGAGAIPFFNIRMCITLDAPTSFANGVGFSSVGRISTVIGAALLGAFDTGFDTGYD